ncbi:hypothetical protein DN33_3569 [Vibrio cholerae]|nr:hypothetical protein DN33_3569 [Vibrio cholerae]
MINKVVLVKAYFAIEYDYIVREVPLVSTREVC